MTAATDARTAAGDAQEAADTVADLTGDGSAQAKAAQAAADVAATAAEATSARAQAATMSADAEGEQTTAETEQGKADNQLAMAQELKRESQVASDAAAQLRARPSLRPPAEPSGQWADRSRCAARRADPEAPSVTTGHLPHHAPQCTRGVRGPKNLL